jgi:hypothetical protein
LPAYVRYAESYGRAQEFSPETIVSSNAPESKAESKDSSVRRDPAASSSAPAAAGAAAEADDAPEVAEMSYDDSSAARQKNQAELAILQATVDGSVVLVIPGDIVHLYLSNGSPWTHCFDLI